MTGMPEIREVFGPQEKATICQSVIAALPAWFGDQETNDEYISDVKEMPLFAAFNGIQLCGFVALNPTSDSAMDIHVLGVVPDWHHQGVGKALVNAAKAYSAAKGALFLTVKTLGPSFKNADYAKTRWFYLAVGFYPLEEHLDYWGKGVPCLQMCQWIGS